MVVKTRRKYGGGNRKTRKMRGGMDRSAAPKQPSRRITVVGDGLDIITGRRQRENAELVHGLIRSASAGHTSAFTTQALKPEGKAAYEQFFKAQMLEKKAELAKKRTKGAASFASSVVDICTISAAIQLARQMFPWLSNTITNTMGLMPTLLENVMDLAKIATLASTPATELATLIYELVYSLPSPVLYITSGMILAAAVSKRGELAKYALSKITATAGQSVKMGNDLTLRIREIYGKLKTQAQVVGALTVSEAAVLATRSPTENGYAMLVAAIGLADKLAEKLAKATPGGEALNDGVKDLIMLLGSNEELIETLKLSVKYQRAYVAEIFSRDPPKSRCDVRPPGAWAVEKGAMNMLAASDRASQKSWGMAAEAIVKFYADAMDQVEIAKAQTKEAQKKEKKERYNALRQEKARLAHVAEHHVTRSTTAAGLTAAPAGADRPRPKRKAAEAATQHDDGSKDTGKRSKAPPPAELPPIPAAAELPPPPKTWQRPAPGSGGGAAAPPAPGWRGGSRKRRRRKSRKGSKRRGGYRYKHKKSHKKRRRPRTRRS